MKPSTQVQITDLGCLPFALVNDPRGEVMDKIALVRNVISRPTIDRLTPFPFTHTGPLWPDRVEPLVNLPPVVLPFLRIGRHFILVFVEQMLVHSSPPSGMTLSTFIRATRSASVNRAASSSGTG